MFLQPKHNLSVQSMVWLVPAQEELHFSVKISSGSFQVTLYSQFGDPSSITYVVQLHASFSELEHVIQLLLLAKDFSTIQKTHYNLYDDISHLWISWISGAIVVGRTRSDQESALLKHTPALLDGITGISFNCTDLERGEHPMLQFTTQQG